MATTTNYGWTTPDDTALVKDGASAIRTLGSSVDTSVKSLNPGTTSGDLDYYTAATTKARIAKGTAGQVFTMNSGATAPEWQTLNAGGMTLISTTTLSGASIVLSSIPATYNSLYVVVQNYLPATDLDNLQMRVNGDANTRYTEFTAFGLTGATTFTLTQVRITPANDNAVSQNLSAIEIFDYKNTTTWKMWRTTSISNDPTTTTSVRGNMNFAVYNQTGAINSLTFLSNSGNLTSGTVLLYGVK
jgi:hypothetical protein